MLRKIFSKILFSSIICSLIFLILLAFGWGSFSNWIENDEYKETRQFTATPLEILNQYSKLNQNGIIPFEEAQKRAKEAVLSLRYKENNYYWLADLQGHLIAHPFKPELAGKTLTVKTLNGKLFSEEVAEIAKTKGEGFLRYRWTKPGSDKIAEKISYVKIFPKWGWIVGAGVYLDDVEATKRKAFGYIAGIAALMITFAAIFVKLTSSFLKPLKTATNTLKKLAENDNEPNKRIEIEGDDEIGELAKWFNVFMDKTIEKHTSALMEKQKTLQLTKDELAEFNEKLGESAESYRLLIAQLPDMVAVHKDGRILYCNQAFIEASQREIEEILDSEITGFFEEKGKESLLQKTIATLEGKDVPNYELVMESKSGQRRQLLVKGAAIDYDGAPAFLMLFKDVTEHKALESQLAQAQKLESIG
ncbi:MAG TPA: hypothetical protein DD435_04425, partial [Cyanobacteria bacterium UBA8530]|nr:hypothetical protein [Cyanobacteria bacterium UBA8530]